jgi:hypothetical protein
MPGLFQRHAGEEEVGDRTHLEAGIRWPTSARKARAQLFRLPLASVK